MTHTKEQDLKCSPRQFHDLMMAVALVISQDEVIELERDFRNTVFYVS